MTISYLGNFFNLSIFWAIALEFDGISSISIILLHFSYILLHFILMLPNLVILHFIFMLQENHFLFVCVGMPAQGGFCNQDY